MELVLLIVLAAVCLGRIVIDWRHREQHREAVLGLRCQNLIRDFQRGER